MELETMERYKLPVIIVVVNNSGIYTGLTPQDFKDVRESVPIDEISKV